MLNFYFDAIAAILNIFVSNNTSKETQLGLVFLFGIVIVPASFIMLLLGWLFLR